MAEKMTDGFVETAFKELAECSICCEIFVEPKMLPCFHTFCVKCLSDYGKDKKPGEMLSCPICRHEFEVPSGGYSTMRGNFFVNRIKDLYQAVQLGASGQTVVLCEACGFGNDGETKSEDVENFCVECRQKMCAKCCTMHKQFAICRTHKIVPLKPGDDSSIKDLLKERTSPCEVHPNERVQLYCLGCKSAICLLCYALKHNGHNCESIEAVAERERQCIDQELEVVSKRIEEIKKLENSVELLKTELGKSVGVAQSSVQNTVAEIIDLFVNHQSNAIDELNMKKQLKEKELIEKINELQTTRCQLESFYQFSRMLMENGNNAEVARYSSDTHQKAKNLVEIVVSKIPAKHEVEINFKKSEFLTKLNKESKNLIGDFSVSLPDPVRVTVKKNVSMVTSPQQRKTVEKVFVTKIKGSGCILGIAVLGLQIFVCRSRSSSIDVFCVNSYQKLRSFAVLGLQDPSDMVSCSLSNCIYINGQEDRRIFKIGMDGKLLDSWKLPDKPFRISVDSNGCVTVTFRDALYLRVYRMDGSFLVDLKLPDDMKSPRNAFFIDSGKFVVCHGELGEPLHRVCELDASGKIMRWYGGAEGSDTTLINVPVHMIRVPNTTNKYLVADLNNHRVHLIADFQLVDHILTPKDGIKLIRKLEMYEERLFIAQDDGCIQVFNVNLEYSTCKQS